MSEVNLSTFPNDKISALTMLYLEQTGVKSLTPEELMERYYEVYKRLSEQNKEIRKNMRSGSSV